MPAVCLYLKAHQPLRIRPYSIFDISVDHEYFTARHHDDATNNERILKKVAEKSYRPTNRLLLSLLRQHPEFRVSFSLTGTLIDQLALYAPDVLESFQELVASERVEILAETYHHSLSFFHSLPEFEEQVVLHEKKIRELFHVTPRIFVNTELAYSNDLAQWVGKKGYTGVVAEGWDNVLGWRSPNYVYAPTGVPHVGLLLKNYKLSDDLAFRFSEQSWQEWPLTVSKYAQWISGHNGGSQVINLFMDYETFGEHQWEESGIFTFLEKLPGELLRDNNNTFMTPSEVLEAYQPVDEVDVPHVLTWADTDRDLTAWEGNKMQQDAIRAVYELEAAVRASGDEKIMHDWRHLLTSDHFYYMCTKWFSDGDVHAYFSPYTSPYDAFLSYMNVIRDMHVRLDAAASRKRKSESAGK